MDSRYPREGSIGPGENLTISAAFIAGARGYGKRGFRFGLSELSAFHPSVTSVSTLSDLCDTDRKADPGRGSEIELSALNSQLKTCLNYRELRKDGTDLSQIRPLPLSVFAFNPNSQLLASALTIGNSGKVETETEVGRKKAQEAQKGSGRVGNDLDSISSAISIRITECTER